MNAIDAILSRRSIRKYTSNPVSKQIITELLEVAMVAPSAANRQPWHFIIIDNRQILDEIPKFHQYSSMLKEASVAILICGDLQIETRESFLVQDCSAATQNLLIAAHAKGLGAVWLGIHPLEDRIVAIQKLLELPEHIIPISLIPIGYPAEQKPPEKRYDESRIHRNQW